MCRDTHTKGRKTSMTLHIGKACHMRRITIHKIIRLRSHDTPNQVKAKGKKNMLLIQHWSLALGHCNEIKVEHKPIYNNNTYSYMHIKQIFDTKYTLQMRDLTKIYRYDF
jgi:hypothetical protein